MDTTPLDGNLLGRARRVLGRYLDWETQQMRVERARTLGLVDHGSGPEAPGELTELAAELAAVVAQLIGARVDSAGSRAVPAQVRRLSEVWPPVRGALRVTLPGGISDAEIGQAAGLVGYAWRATVAGDPLGLPVRVTDDSFEVDADLRTSSRTDAPAAAVSFDKAVAGMLAEGSPVRQSNREGVGTRGTRLLDGLGERWRLVQVRYVDAQTPLGSVIR